MIEFTIHTTSLLVDDLSSELMEQGAAAVTWKDAGDQPIYEPKPDQVIVWEQVAVSAIFEDDTLIETVSDYLHRHQYPFEVHTVPENDWVRMTQAQFVPLQFGERLWICPSWHEPPNPKAVNVLFDAGIAFGTGAHPTTALCLEWLATHIKGHESFIDYGCGSGILAVSALKLGAAFAIGVDHDPQALDATMMNATLNHVAERLKVYLPDAMPTASVDILIANIISQPLIELAPRFTSLVRSGGQLVLSGLLTSQIQAVMSAYQQAFDFTEPVISDGWVRLHAIRM